MTFDTGAEGVSPISSDIWIFWSSAITLRNSSNASRIHSYRQSLNASLIFSHFLSRFSLSGHVSCSSVTSNANVLFAFASEHPLSQGFFFKFPFNSCFLEGLTASSFFFCLIILPSTLWKN